MLFAVDIDRTICQGFKPYLHYQNQDLDLGLPTRVLEALADYQSFLRLPAVKSYRQTHEAAFQASQARCRLVPDIILALEAIAGSVEGTSLLARQGTVRYYTIRAAAVHKATSVWLARQGFPNPDDVVFCSSSLEKLLALAQHVVQEPIVLIDDKGDRLVRAFEDLTTQSPPLARRLRQHLVLVVFGAQTAPMPDSPLDVVALPSWDHVSDLMSQLSHRLL